MTFTHYCLLGSSKNLSYRELLTVLSRLGLPEASPLNSQTPFVALDLNQFDPQVLINVLGGTVKIYRVLPVNASFSQASQIYSDLKDHSQTQFCLQAYPSGLVSTGELETEIKRLANNEAYRVSFRRLKNLTDSAGILRPYQEYVIYHHPETNETQILKTVAVQDIRHWTQKDYARPEVMPQAGMLPPKISRQLINLALTSPLTPSTVIYDPFCGVGTVLIEGLDLGLSVYGSDISTQAIESAQKNIDWYRQYRPFEGEIKLFTANVLQTLPLPPESVDAVVAEGYLGPAQIMPHKIDDYVKGLTKFYLGAFKRLRMCLIPQA